MLFTNFLLVSLVACEDNFDKGGEIIVPEAPPEQNDELENEDENIPTLEDKNHDWDLDGFTEEQGDCNDDDSTIHPEAEESFYDNQDQNCDGLDDYDADGDGFVSIDWGGDDCNDEDQEIHPEAEEHPADGIDSDCGGEEETEFLVQEIDPNSISCSGRNAMDVDSTGLVHVVYEDNGQLWYSNSSEFGVWRTPTQLKSETSLLFGQQALSGAVDGLDNFHVTFTIENPEEETTSLQYTYMTALEEWTSFVEIDGAETTESQIVGEYASIAIGSDDLPVFGYYNRTANAPFVTKLAQLPSAETEIEFLYRYQADFLAFETDKLIGTHTGLTVGTDNQAHLFFRDEAAPYGTGQIPETQYSSNNDEGEVCLSESVALTGGHWHSAEVNKDGAVCVAYQDEETLKLHYACQSHVASCVQWDVEVADNTYNVGAHTSLGFTSENQPYISYYDTENGSLKLATKVDGNWQAITLDGDEDKDVGLFTNLNIDTEDKIHITYQNQTDNSIWYAVGH